MGALLSIRPRSNYLTSNFIHHHQHKMSLTFTLTHCTVMSSTSNTHSISSSQYVFLKSRVTASLTQASPPHPIPPLPKLSLLSNYIQHYTGGSWVRRQTRSSGEWCKSCSGPLIISSFLWSSSSCSTPQLQLACCLLVISACLIASMSALSLFLK